jgi:hypothetical protein
VKYLLVISLIAVSQLLPSQAFGQEAGLAFGNGAGFGMFVRGQKGVSLTGNAGIVPFINIIETDDEDVDISIYFPARFGLELGLPIREDENQRLAVVVGFSYDTLLREGIMTGMEFVPEVNGRFRLSAGVGIFPAAERELRRRYNKEHGTDFSSDQLRSPLAVFQPMLTMSVSL